MIGLVVLSGSYVDLNVQSPSKALDQLYPGNFVPLEQQANFVVRGSGPGQFPVKSTIPGAAGMFMVAWHWDAFQLLLLYWGETVLLFVRTLAHIACIPRRSSAPC